MFVYSVKTKHIRVIFLAAFVLFTAVSLMILSNESQETSSNNDMILSAETHEERMKFISQFGWQVEEEPYSVKEVIIPEEADDVYNAYNELQRLQGFDLNEYAGVRAKCWTYVIKNYEGYENQECIHANILVYDGAVIGGDICSVELDGFMHGFSGENGKT
ncbi:MAG: DUF4830 domain-containing protein [Clostridia bacterium]|nr:DUF4830 domain-containing protein [Clostridia bacterium]